MKTKRISKNGFTRKLLALTSNYRIQIENYVISHENQIDHFEYGHDKKRHIRVYKIVLRNGFSKSWGATRNY